MLSHLDEQTSYDIFKGNGKHGLRLHIGCGFNRIEGFVNCDFYKNPNVDLAFNCEERWPFDDNSAVDLYTSHMLEHLHNPKEFFKEAWRVLQPNASLLIRVPYGGHRAAWWDLEHIRPWFAENFCYLQPGYGRSVANPQHDEWTATFGIQIIQLRCSYRLTRLLKHWWGRWIFGRWPALFDPEVEELWAYLFAIKTPEAAQIFLESRPAHCAPMQYVSWKHHMDNVPPPTDDTCTLVPHSNDALFGTVGCRFVEPHG